MLYVFVELGTGSDLLEDSTRTGEHEKRKFGLQAMGPSAALEAEDAELFSKYASKLAEQGLFVTAAKYSKYVLVSVSLSLGLIMISSTNCLPFFSFPGAIPWRVRY
jgi:hypothetical protein